MFGPLPIPASVASKGATDGFPHNVTFRAADWVKEEIQEDVEGYDVVVAYVYLPTANAGTGCAYRTLLPRFSISKWIHLNGGDEGLMTFFRRVHKVLRSGGTFVLEPQEWDTYGKAKRMDPVRNSIHVYGQIAHSDAQRLKENAKHLSLRPEHFERVLEELGFGSAEHLGAAGDGGKSNGRCC